MLNWKQLLTPARIRELGGGEQSYKWKVDVRTPIERDYDRTIYSAPFRRLQDKAQVYSLVTQDNVRTRLTHSIEVSTLASDLGQQAAHYLLDQAALDSQEDAHALGRIAATCGLLHDLGNPPFGHAGERAIASWFTSRRESGKLKPRFDGAWGVPTEQLFADFEKFDGNAQTIRLICRLQVLSDLFGLNLTAATVAAAIKYVPASHQSGKDKGSVSLHKPGYFASEAEIVGCVRKVTGLGERRHPITYLVEAADDIVNAVVDVEDAVRRGSMEWQAVESMLESEFGKDFEVLLKCREYVDRSSSLMRTKRARDEALASTFRTYGITFAVPQIMDAFKSNLSTISEGEFKSDLASASTAADFIKKCKRLLPTHVFGSPSVLRTELKGRTIIQELLDIFWEGIKCHIDGEGSVAHEFSKRAYDIMSDNYRLVFEKGLEGQLPYKVSLPPDYFGLRMAVDYVCGMTDRFASDLHRELFNGG